MKYDFKTLINRKDSGSYKWDKMRGINKDIPDNIVPFSVADMEFKNPPEILIELKEFMENSVLGYSIPTENYYRAICSWMKRKHDWNIEKEWIVGFPGVVPALYTSVRACTEPGEGVIIMTPVYYPFYGAIKHSGRKIIENELLFCEDHYEIDYDGLEEKARDENNKLLILCNPHNPVGRVWKIEELKKLGEICQRNGVIVVSDEIHFDLIMKGYKHTVFASISEEFSQNCITCTAPSKTFNLAGLKVSNIIIQNPKLREKVQKENSIGGGDLNILGYKACEIAYTKCEDWLSELLDVLEENKKYLNDFLEENLPEIKIIELEGTYLQWLDFRAIEKDHKKLEVLMQEKAYLYLDEGYIFGRGGRGFERINIACPKYVLEDALNRLKKVLDNSKIILK